MSWWRGVGGLQGADDVSKYPPRAYKRTYSAIFFCTDTNQVSRAQALFYGGLVSIVSLEMFAEACDLGQGLREAINNSESMEELSSGPTSKNCATSLTGRGGRSQRAASNKDSEVSVWWESVCVRMDGNVEQDPRADTNPPPPSVNTYCHFYSIVMVWSMCLTFLNAFINKRWRYSREVFNV